MYEMIRNGSQQVLGSEDIVTDTENWYALWVKSRHEFVTAGELTQKGVENFVPSVPRVRQWKDRKKTIDFPLFPGYLFVHIMPRPDEFLQIVKTRGAVKFVSLEPGHPTPVSSIDIESLRKMLASGDPIDVFPSLKVGTAVRVKRGPLAGAVGIMAKRQNDMMFIVNFDILGRSVGLKIHAEDIEQAF